MFVCVCVCVCVYVLKSSTIVGAAAYAGEEEKDICHEAEVAAAAALFYPLVVESFGFCTPVPA